jgi:hypothetical protein
MRTIKRTQYPVWTTIIMALWTFSPARAALDMHYEVPAGTSLHVQGFHEQVKTNFIVNSLPGSSGYLVLDFPDQVSWTGTTSVGYGSFELSALGGAIHTANQGSWTVGPAATLDGAGEIGLAPGERVSVAGVIGMSGDDPARRFIIRSDLIMQSGSTMAIAGGYYSMPDRFEVTGLLDMAGTGDALRISLMHSPVDPEFPPSNVLASYGSRVGEFDSVTGLHPGWSIVYTSPPNAGPGQILLLTPEPAALAPLAGFSILRRPRKVRQ